jgi:hypothetical protein
MMYLSIPKWTFKTKRLASALGRFPPQGLLWCIGPLWVGSRRSDCHDFVNLSVAYRPIAVIRQARKTPHWAGLLETLLCD